MSAFQDYSKFLEGGLGQAELVGAPGWQPPWRAPLQRKAPFYPGDDIYHADTWRELEASTQLRILNILMHLYIHTLYRSLTLPSVPP